jgi:succinyl-diaminopimelate desuccinylase
VAEAVQAKLAAHHLPAQEVASQSHTPNLISSLSEGAGPHLILIGHMDTYPAGDEGQWAHPPFSGLIDDGRLHGRGAGDMKSGLSALLFAYLALAHTRAFSGRVTFMAVSDEMNFSPHGARWVLGQRPDLLGDAALDAEPTSPDFVLFGEKGMVWVEVICSGVSGAGAFAPGQPNAIELMMDVLRDLARLREWPVTLPPEVIAGLQMGGGTTGVDPAALTYVSDNVLPLVTVNIGTITGGRKINLVADECRAEVDIRLPPGLRLPAVLEFLDNVFAKHDRAQYRVIQSTEPNWTDPNDPLLRHLYASVTQVRGVAPRPEIGITASDTRLFRAQGRPAAMVGPRIAGQGGANESIAVQDLIDCAKIFALTAHDYGRNAGFPKSLKTSEI